jgi:uncharacterized protein YcfJ
MHTPTLKITTLALSLCSTAAFAAHENRADVFFDEANVINVEPIIRTVQVTVPQRECYQQEVRTPVYQGGRGSEGATVVGGVVGGILGHKLSHGHGPGTVAGTLLGAAIGNQIGQANAQPPSYHEDISYQERCDVHELSHSEQRTEGYRVTYRYKGETFTTQMPHEPGKHLRVQVSVTPVNN